MEINNIEPCDLANSKLHKTISEDKFGYAALTHYLHNYKNGVSKKYKGTALKQVQRLLEYKNPSADITHNVADKALQYLLFNLHKTHPFPSPGYKTPSPKSFKKAYSSLHSPLFPVIIL